MSSAADRKRRSRARQELRAEGYELFDDVPVDVAALERARLLPPAESIEERVEQIGALLDIVATPRVAAVLRVVLEQIHEEHTATAESASRCDIDELLSKNQNGGEQR